MHTGFWLSSFFYATAMLNIMRRDGLNSWPTDGFSARTISIFVFTWISLTFVLFFYYGWKTELFGPRRKA